jgi:chemotaxis protein MotB
MNGRVCGALALAVLLGGGCVTKSKYTQALDEKAKLDAAAQAEATRRAELEKEREALQQRLQSAEQRLTAKDAERRSLEERNKELASLNDELARNTQQLAAAKQALEAKSAEYEALTKSMQQEIQNGQVEISELRGQMTVLLKDKILFASGSARVGAPGTEALRKVAEALRSVQGRIIRVEGHTDDLPTDPKGAFPTNWELSVARALAVVRTLQDAGVDPTQLSAAGYGPYHPVAANDSPENRSLNRRIEIVLAPAMR